MIVDVSKNKTSEVKLEIQPKTKPRSAMSRKELEEHDNQQQLTFEL